MLFIVALGNGVLLSLTTLRLDAAGASATMTGIVSPTALIYENGGCIVVLRSCS